MDEIQEFPVLSNITFMNHAGVSPLPARAARALTSYADEAARHGAAIWPVCGGRLKAARRRGAARLVEELK